MWLAYGYGLSLFVSFCLTESFTVVVVLVAARLYGLYIDPYLQGSHQIYMHDLYLQGATPLDPKSQREKRDGENGEKVEGKEA